ncbi:Putative hydrolase MhqD [Frondihabitans sp. 762G35]|uniref:alpha/beta hydrolase n=1 Tax=Frondihabitans sp. 762G35 TaxID=1446794 RepID=UPI000D227EA2|nr:alpha/beta hydrolase [Frondihabitans sp. 762G35]ARC58621.1 Putative hydrolase MhqD [Frondihabitans sp. 762G35]
MSESTAGPDWPHIFIPGSGPVVLALHGTGGTEADAAPLAQTLLPKAAVIAPRGRVLEQGLSRWFRREAEGVFDVDDVIKQALLLNDFIVTITREHGLTGRTVIAIGFSNGANMSLALAMLHPKTVHAAVAFSGMYPFGDKEAPRDLSESRFLLFNGQSDAMAPQSSVHLLIDQLLLRHAHVDYRLRPGGHGITPDELATARGWLESSNHP